VKRIYQLTFLFTVVSSSLRAQWTTNASGDAYNNNASGKVGIGTASPGAQLDIKSSSVFLNFTTSRGFSTSRNWGFVTSWLAEGDFAILQSTTNANNPSLNRFAIDPNGNVGIGTSSPQSLLHLNSTVDARKTFRIYWNNNTSNYLSLFQGDYGAAIDPIGTGLLYLGYDQSTNVIVGNNGGRLGIGTASPSSKLTIDGIDNYSDGITIQNTTGYKHLITAFSDGVNPATGSALQFKVANNNVGGNVAVMTLKGSGNVGIGTTAPNFKLELVANTQFAIGKTYMDNCLDGNNGYVRSNFGSNVFWDGVNHVWQVKQIGNNDFSAMIHPNGDGLAFVTAVSDGNVAKSLTNSQFMAYERMRISANGNVGIGTTSPDAKLAVKGQVHAQEVKVDLNGAVAPDYVFEKDYQLTSLEEIKNYIDQNKHLPEVPSAKEMEKNGVQLGEMNMLLLKKIEELTLYIINQQKQIDELKKTYKK